MERVKVFALRLNLDRLACAVIAGHGAHTNEEGRIRNEE